MKFLCPSDTLAPDSSRGFEIDGCKLFAVRRDGVAYFYIKCRLRPLADWALSTMPGRDYLSHR